VAEKLCFLSFDLKGTAAELAEKSSFVFCFEGCFEGARL
jgi:hypothetical protein